MFPTRFLLNRVGPILLNYHRNISCYHPKNRQLIGLSGTTVTEFLQGIISNDIRTLDCKSSSCMYSFFLNTKGRIVTDSFVYRIKETVSSQDLFYLVEFDGSLTENIVQLLNMYNFRKKVKVWVEEDIRVWIVLPSMVDGVADTTPTLPTDNSLLFYASDPRALPGWSSRFLAKRHFEARQAFGPECSSSLTDEDLASVYTSLRYRLAIPEGPMELKPGVGLPLESNADLCGGVSFTKGCYVGQELTTRSHFTGVIRKRVAPILLTNSTCSPRIPFDAPIYHVNSLGECMKQQPIGWIRGIEETPSAVPVGNQQHRWGIALLRLSDAAAAVTAGDHLWAGFSDLLPDNFLSDDSSKGVFIHPYVPDWWPITIGTGLPRLSLRQELSHH